MNILVIGQGGREHALTWKLKQSPRVSKIYCAPGNGGTATLAENVPVQANEIDRLVQLAKEKKIDYTIVGPEEPLVAGIVDAFEKEGLHIYGPRQAAAMIEGSKSFAKELMMKYGIPTARYETFTVLDEALSYLDQNEAPIVVKADGLAAGKGVTVAESRAEAKEAVKAAMAEQRFGDSGLKVVIEEFLVGEEMTLMAFVDGEVVVPMVTAQDHKPIYEGDRGPNTGGMGAYAPVPHIDEEIVSEAVETILKPAAKALAAEGRPYQGVLYAGLIITAEGPKVIEFNARFGDPETQVVLPLLKTDLIDVVEATCSHRLDQLEIEWYEQTAVNVVAASSGYPGDYTSGYVITGLEHRQGEQEPIVFHAGTKMKDGQLITNGGRVLSVTAVGDDLAMAREHAYQTIETISFEGIYYRTDIGHRALVARR